MTCRPRAIAAAIMCGLGVVALAAAVNVPAGGAILRHLYVLPVGAAALRFGVVGGTLAAGGVLVADGPAVLAAVEREGVTDEAIERMVTFAVVAVAGLVAGSLADEIRARRRRYDTLVAVQRVLAEDRPLDDVLPALRACLERHLGGVTVGLVLQTEDRIVVAGAGAPAPDSLAAAVLADGRPRFVRDADPPGPPRRAFAAPLVAGGGVVGALLVEGAGEMAAGERRALAALGVHLGLAIENARLAWRQRRFAEELEAKVAEATDRLVALDDAKSRFLAVASHELRTPLTALLGFAELLATRGFPAPEVTRLAGIIGRETERLVRIVDDLLDLSRLERGIPPALRCAEVNVGAALQAAVDLFAAARPTHRFTVDCTDPALSIRADPDALDRILRNLVSNAVKYSPAGSTVTVRARRSSYPAHVEIAVEDEGGGIPPDALPRIFEPYYRVPATAPTVRGTGLGLAVVKALVDAHGGAIEAASVPQVGTRIAFLLPCAP